MSNFPTVSYERLPEHMGPHRGKMIEIAKACQIKRRKDPSKLDVGNNTMHSVFFRHFSSGERQLFGEYLNERAAPELVIGMTKGFRKKVLVALEQAHPGKVFTPQEGQIKKDLYNYDIWYEIDRLKNIQGGHYVDSPMIPHDAIHCTVRQYLKRPIYPAYLAGPREVSSEFSHDVEAYGLSIAKLMHEETLEEELFSALWGGIENPVFLSLLNELRTHSKSAKKILKNLKLPPNTALEDISDEQLFYAYILANKDYLIGTFGAEIEDLMDESKSDSLMAEVKAKQRARVDHLMAHPPAALRPLFNVMLRQQFDPKTRRLNQTPSLFRLWKNIAQGRCNADNIESLYPEAA